MTKSRTNTKGKDNKPLSNEPCRTCGKPVREDASHYPFCSERCRMGDLGKWFSGEYTISRPLEERDLEEGVE